MLRYLITSILIICSFTLLGQNLQINGKVIDENQAPVPFVSLSVEGTYQGTISNGEGNFSLEYKGANSDTICFSHINYQKKYLPARELLQEDNVIVELHKKDYEIDEINITERSISKIIDDAVDHSVDLITDNLPIYLKTYYREFVGENDSHTKFSDGLLDYYISEKSGKTKSKVKVNQSRAMEISSDVDESEFDILSPLDINSVKLIELIEEIKDIFRKESLVNYNFKLVTSNTDERILKIEYEPKSEKDAVLYYGTIEINQEENLIMSFEKNLDPSHAEFSKEINLIILKGKLLETESKIIFETAKNMYHLKYLKRRFDIKIWNRKRINIKYSFVSDLLVFDIEDIISKNPIKNKESENKKSLYSLGNNYQTEFWKNPNIIQFTENEEKIIDQIK